VSARFQTHGNRAGGVYLTLLHELPRTNKVEGKQAA
jgi:hypothetical protein